MLEAVALMQPGPERLLGIFAGIALAAATLAGAAPAAGLLFLVVLSAKYYWFRPFSSSRHDLLPALLVFLFLAKDLAGRVTRRSRTWEDRVVLDVMYAVLGALFLEAAIHKLVHFADWSAGRFLSDLLEYRALFTKGHAAPPAPAAAAALAWATLLFEGLFLAGLPVRRARIPFLAAALVFQVTVYLVLNVNFLIYQAGILLVMIYGEKSARAV